MRVWVNVVGLRNRIQSNEEVWGYNRFDAMPGLIEQAWRMVASPKLIKAYDEDAD